MASFDLVRLGALGAILAGLVWIASGFVAAAVAGGAGFEVLGIAALDETLLYVVALLGTLGGILSLHVRQAPGYGRLGRVGFLTAFAGTALLGSGLILSLVAGGILGAFLDWVLGLGLWSALVGFVLLGAATLRLKVLPPWCGWVLILCPPLAIALGDYGGGIVLGLAWVALGYMLWSQHDVSALLRTRRRRG